MKKSHWILSISIIAFLLLVGCNSSSKNGGDSGSDDIKDKLIFAPNTDVQTLDPHHANDHTSMQAIEMIYSSLLTYDDDLNIVGDLAEDWGVSEDGLKWTFQLKEGITFHDGAEFNADTVKISFERLLDMSNGLVQSNDLQFITNVEVLSDFEIEFETEEPYGMFEDQMAAVSTSILSPKVIEEFGNDSGKVKDSAIGTGPYKIAEWKKDQILVFERFDNYFGEQGITQTIEYKPIPEDATRVMALEAGEVDVIQQIPAQDLSRLESLDGLELVKVLGISQRQFRFDVSKAPFDDTKVRQAILYAVDREIILDKVVPGIGELPTSALPSVLPDYIDLGEITYDPEKAKTLLAEAGYPEGFKTKITTTSRYLQGVEIAEVLADQLKGVGIEAEINVMEWGDISDEWGGLTPDEFDQGIFIMGTGGTNADRQLRGIYYTAETNERNYGFYSNEEFDQIIIEAMSEVDEEKRRELYHRAQEIVYLEDPASFFLYDQYTIIGQRDNVENVSISPFSMITFEKAFVNKK